MFESSLSMMKPVMTKVFIKFCEVIWNLKLVKLTYNSYISMVGADYQTILYIPRKI